MRRILLSFVILLLLGAVCGQDSNQVRKYIRDLTSPEFHGRGYAYNGDSIAAKDTCVPSCVTSVWSPL